MNHQRMTVLLVGHTLAEGRPLGTLLRDLGEPSAASHAESGDLDTSLRYLNLSEELRHLAQHSPSALRPTQERLAALPSPLIFQLPLLQTMGYLAMVSVLQGFSILMLRSKILPTLQEMTVDPSFDFIQLATLGLGALIVFLPVGTRLLSRQRPWNWSLHYERARQAAVAAGMAAAGASPEARREFSERLPLLAQDGSSVAELDLIIDRSLVLAEQAQQRLVSIVKLIGIGGLVGIASLITVNIYQIIASISVNM